MKPFIRYVLIVAIDPESRHVVGMTKLKGPPDLIGKFNFPGGKLEEGESAIEAGVRELREEVGIEVPVTDVRVIDFETGATSELTKLAVVTDKVLQARQLEKEPVWHMAFDRHLEYCLRQPEAYAPDFRSTLLDALVATQVPLHPAPHAYAP